ncbi:hypothetical protein [Massilia rhizosphaerae]|uniref:hypothetical protein n=1 Tax=Massilia rhizosphaerae TaxID=2784389 RepID=UPI0018DCE860|nr:hypothetical protein [Massilia rhizosphaerae]
MVALVTHRVRTIQPQSNIQIDWSNPLTQGLVFAYTCGNEVQGWGEDGRNGIQYVQVSTGNPVGRAINTLSGTGGQLLSSTSGYLFGSPSQTSVKSGVYSLFSFGTGPSSGIQSALDDDDGTNRRFQFRINAGKVEFNPFYSGGNGNVISPVALSATDLATGFAMGATVNGTAYAAYQKGIKTSGTPMPSTALTPNTSIMVGARKVGTTQCWLVGGLMLVAMWNRPLTDAEHASLADNPWQLFQASPRRIWMPQPASNLGGALFDSAGLTASSGTGTLATGIALNSASTSLVEASVSVTSSISLASAGTAISLAVAELIAQIQLNAVAANDVSAGSDLVTQVQLASVASTASAAGVTLLTQIPIGSAGYSQTDSASALAIAAAWGSVANSASSAYAALTTGVQIGAAAYEACAGSSSLSTGLVLDGAAITWARAAGALTSSIKLAASGVDAQTTSTGRVTLATSVGLFSQGATGSYANTSLAGVLITYASAPAGPGYAPKKRYNESRPAGANSSRPEAIQRNLR